MSNSATSGDGPEAVEDEAASGDGEEVEQAGSEQDPAALLETLYERRHHWQAQEAELEASHFKWFLRGGLWAASKHGVPFDTFGGEALRGAATEWCLRVGLLTSASFVCKLYSEEGAQVLAKCWCARMQWLFDKGLAASEPAPQGGAPAAPACPEPPELEAIESGAGPAFRQRLAQIRGLWPCTGSASSAA